MPRILESEALALAQNIDSLDDTQKPQALDILTRYKQQQDDFGEPEWPTQSRQREGEELRFRSMFEDLANVDKAAPSLVETLQYSDNPDADRARVASIAYLSRVYGKPADEIGRSPDLYRNDYTTRRGQKSTDDLGFYKLASAEVAAMQRKENAFLEGSRAALRGENVISSLQGWQGKNLDMMEDSSQFTQGFLRAQEKAGDMIPLADKMLKLIESGTGKSNSTRVFDAEAAKELDDMTAELATMKPRERKEVYASIAARVEAAGYDQKGFWSQMLGQIDQGLFRMSQTVPQGMGSVLGTIGEFVGGEDTVYDREDLDRRSKERGEETTAEMKLRQEKLGEVQSEIAQIISGTVDPVKTTVGWIPDYLEAGAIKGPGAVLPFMTASAALGPYGAGLVFTADFAEQNRRDLVAAGLDRDDAARIGVMAAPLQAAVESLSNAFQLGKWASPIAPGSSFLKRYVTNSIASGATEFTEEQVQENIIRPIVQDVVGMIDANVPQIGFGEMWGKMKSDTPELISVLAPMALVFGGVMTNADLQLSRDLTGNVDGLTAVGYSQAQATTVIQEKDEAGRIAKARELWGVRAGTKESMQSGAAKLSEKLRLLQSDASTAQAELERRGMLPRMLHAEEGNWRLTFNDGSVADFQTHNEANAARWSWAQDQLGEFHAITRETLASLEKNLDVGREVAVEFKPDARTAADAVKDGASREMIGRRVGQGKALGDVDAGTTYDEAMATDKAASIGDEFLSSLQILGSSKTEFLDGIMRTTIKLWEGSNVLTLVEEKLEGDAKAMIRTPQGRDWLLSRLRNYEQASGDKVFRDVADDQLQNDDIVEAWSHVGQSYLVGRSTFGEPLQGKAMRRFGRFLMRAGLGGAFNSESAFFAAVAGRAQKLMEAKKAGTLPADFTEELERQLGIDSQVKHDAGALQEAASIIDTSGYSEETPGPNGETFSLAMQHNGGIPFRAGDRVRSLKFEATVYSVEPREGVGYWVVYTDASGDPEWKESGRRPLEPFAKPFDRYSEPVKVLQRGNSNPIRNEAFEALKESRAMGAKTDVHQVPVRETPPSNIRYTASKKTGKGVKASSLKVGDTIQLGSEQTVTAIDRRDGGFLWLEFESGNAGMMDGDSLVQVKILEENGKPVDQGATFSLARVTPAQDADYLAAVERGDMETAQRMVDEAARAAGYDTKAWHGSPDEDFTVFQKPEKEADEDGFWFSKDRDWASKFGPTRLFYIKDVKTWGGDDFVVKNPSSIKSADPITRDAEGNVIPLSQRFNPADDRITYSIASGDFAARMEAMPFKAEQDAEYLAAVQAGGMEKAQRMVDEAVRAAGYNSETLFRGRQDTGNVVSFGKDGAHFTPVREYAEGYAEGEFGNVVSGKAKIIKPLRIDLALIESDSFETFKEHLSNQGLLPSTPARLFEWSQNPKYNQTKTIGEAIDAIESDSNWADFQEDPSSSFTDNLGSAIWPLGFDAIRTLEHGNRELPVVILKSPSQIKSADPVTRDADGNVIPLSQRFNPERNEITFSLRSGDFEARAAAMFSPFQRTPELRMAIARVAKERVFKVIPQLLELRGELNANAKERADIEIRFSEEMAMLRTDFEADEKQVRDERDFELKAVSQDKGSELDRERLRRTADKKLARLRLDYERTAAEAEKRKASELSKFDKKDNRAQRDRIKQLLRVHDALLSAIPAEVRPQVGGYVRIAELNTDEKAIAFLEDRVQKMEKVLEKWLTKQAREQLTRIFKKAKPKAEAGEKAKGKLTPEVHAWFALAEEASTLSPAAADERIEGIANSLSQEMTPAIKEELSRWIGRTVSDDAEAQDWQEQRMTILQTFGSVLYGTDAKPARGAGDTTAAFDLAKEVYTDGRLAHIEETAKKRERREADRGDGISRLGGPYDPEKATQRKKALNKLAGLKGRAADYLDTGLDASGFFLDILGDGNLYENTRRNILEADMAKDDAMRKRKAEFAAMLTEVFPKKGLTARLRGLWELQQIQTDSPVGTLSQLQAMQFTLWFQDMDSREWLESNGYGEEWQAKAEAWLTSEARGLRSWLMKQYAGQYDRINPVFRRLRGVNLPRVDVYGGKRQVEHSKADSSVALETDMMRGGMEAGFTKTRVSRPTGPPKITDALQNYWQNAHQVEHYIAFAETVTELKAVFGHRDFRLAVETNRGQDKAKQVSDWIANIEQAGSRDAFAHTAQGLLFGRYGKAVSASALMFKLSVLAKQAPAAIQSAFKVGLKEYFASLARVMSGKAAISLGEMYQSDTVQRRLSQHDTEMQQASKGWNQRHFENEIIDKVAMTPDLLMNAGWYAIGWTDARFTTVSAAVAYDVAYRDARRLGSSEEEAKAFAADEAALIVMETAQPQSVATKSLFENQTPMALLRFLFAFQGANRQVFGLTYLALKKGGVANAWGTAALIAGVAQTVGGLIRMMTTDDEPEELFKPEAYALGMATAPLTGMMGLGLIVEAIGNGVGVESRISASPVTMLASAIKDIAEGDADVKDVSRSMSILGTVLGGRGAALGVGWNVLNQLFGFYENVAGDE